MKIKELTEEEKNVLPRPIYSLENIKQNKPPGASIEVSYFASYIKENKITDYYMDKDKTLWYKTRFIENGQIITEEEHIFNKKK